MDGKRRRGGGILEGTFTSNTVPKGTEVWRKGVFGSFVRSSCVCRAFVVLCVCCELCSSPGIDAEFGRVRVRLLVERGLQDHGTLGADEVPVHVNVHAHLGMYMECMNGMYVVPRSCISVYVIRARNTYILGRT